jgi:hypothetical protein
MRSQPKGINVFTNRKAEKPSPVDVLIETTVSEMQGFEPYSEEYRNAAIALKTLMEAKATERKPERLSPNTIATIAGNAGMVIMILVAEHTGIVRSAGLGFLLKPKI